MILVPFSGLFLAFALPDRFQAVVLVLVVAITAGVILLLSVVIFRDARTVIEKTDWESGPGRWGLLTAIIPLVGVLFYLLERHQAITEARQRRFDECCEEYDKELSKLETRMQPYFDVVSYLTYYAHENLQTVHERLVEDRQRIAETAANTRSIDTKGQLDEFETRLQEVHDILVDRKAYNDRFVDRELERREAFFSDLGQKGYSLNRRQQEAVVRNDTYNRVIAGAGTGKTLVLTTRVAYLVKHRGVPPEDILVATFTGNAAEEMEQRLQRDFDISGVEATTLHSFGYGVLKRVRGNHPDVFDEDDREHFVRDVVDRETPYVPERFYDHLTGFLLHRDVPAIEETDFETREEYVETLRRKTYETLRGEEVKSRAEKVIADFLHIHQVDYRYEQRAESINSRLRSDDDRLVSSDLEESRDDDADKGAYRPDFYIPSADLYIEHFGIDEAGEVADYFETTTVEYVEGIHWARGQFAEVDATLVETYQFEFDAGRLRKALEHRLTHHGLSLDPMSHTELVNETYEIHEQAIPLWQQLSRFIELARTFRISPSEIPSQLSPSRAAQYHFGMCGGLLLHMYEQTLSETRSVDFPGMIHGATQSYEEDSRLLPQFEHILIDEFQDIGQDQLQLIEILSGPDEAKLFAVGDDWQSIYSFQGAIVNLFINFEEHFGPAITSTLETNYRSPAQLVQAGASLIQHNGNQLEKDISAASEVDASVVKHRLGGHTERDHIEYSAQLAVYLVTSYLENGCAPDDIMVLCRYDDAVHYLDAVRRRLMEHGIPFTDANASSQSEREGDEKSVIVNSVHKVKGQEADHVIVTHVSEDGLGFPATDRDTNLLEPVQEVEMNTMAEERRLFYVAISRSIRTLDIITKTGSESRFIDEIDEYVDQAVDASNLVNLDADSDIDEVSAKVAKLWDTTHPTIHQSGILEDGTDSIRFVSWANSDPPTLTEDTWYRFEGIHVDEYKSEPQVQTKRWTEVTEITPEEARVSIEDLHRHLAEADNSVQIDETT